MNEEITRMKLQIESTMADVKQLNEIIKELHTAMNKLKARIIDLEYEIDSIEADIYPLRKE